MVKIRPVTEFVADVRALWSVVKCESRYCRPKGNEYFYRIVLHQPSNIEFLVEYSRRDTAGRDWVASAQVRM